LIGSLVRIATAAAIAFSLAVSPAWSRQWKATPEALARDYATINDTRPDGELVLLLWFVPPMIRPETPGASAITGLLRKNIVLMAVDGRLDKASGTLSFQEISGLEARDQNGRTLVPIEKDQLPPATVGAVTVLETAFRQSLGNMGKGTKLFVFDAASVDACGKGRLSVSLANETYTWDTPIPGCSPK
jgi:hypothetical protein